MQLTTEIIVRGEKLVVDVSFRALSNFQEITSVIDQLGNEQLLTLSKAEFQNLSEIILDFCE